MENKTVLWKGEDGLSWRAELGIHDAAPCIFSLEYEMNGQWVKLAGMLKPQFKVVTSERTPREPSEAKDS